MCVFFVLFAFHGQSIDVVNNVITKRHQSRDSKHCIVPTCTPQNNSYQQQFPQNPDTPILLFYTQWNLDTTMGQGTDQMHLLLQGFVAVYQIVFIYFTFPRAIEFSSFCLGLVIWGSLSQGSTVHSLFFVLHHFCVCLLCSYTHVNFVVSLLFRCGFASETSPRHIIRSVLTHTINGQVSCHRNTTSMWPNVRWLVCYKVRYISRSSQWLLLQYVQCIL